MSDREIAQLVAEENLFIRSTRVSLPSTIQPIHFRYPQTFLELLVVIWSYPVQYDEAKGSANMDEARLSQLYPELALVFLIDRLNIQY